MKILLTGANGRIGRALRRSALARSHEFTWVVRPGVDGSADEIRVDLAKPGVIEDLIVALRPDVVVHLAAILGQTSPEEAENVNVALVERISKASVNAAVSHLLLASSAAVYGDRSSGTLAEDTALRPTTAYGDAKVRAEHAIAAATSSTSTVSSIMRIFNVYGPGFEDSLVNRLTDSSPDQPVGLVGFDHFIRDYVHIDDVVRAVEKIIERRPTTNTVVNIASGVPRSNRSLILELNKVHRVHYIVNGTVSSESAADITEARRLFRYEPRWTSTLGPTA